MFFGLLTIIGRAQAEGRQQLFCPWDASSRPSSEQPQTFRLESGLTSGGSLWRFIP